MGSLFGNPRETLGLPRETIDILLGNPSETLGTPLGILGRQWEFSLGGLGKQ